MTVCQISPFLRIVNPFGVLLKVHILISMHALYVYKSSVLYMY